MGLGPWPRDGEVDLSCVMSDCFLDLHTVEAMGRDFVASQRHALWERICQRQITCSVWVRKLQMHHFVLFGSQTCLG